MGSLPVDPILILIIYFRFVIMLMRILTDFYYFYCVHHHVSSNKYNKLIEYNIVWIEICLLNINTIR